MRRLSTFKTRQRNGLRLPSRPLSAEAVTARYREEDKEHVERLLSARDVHWGSQLVDLRRSVQKLQRAVGRSALEVMAGRVVELKAEYDARLLKQAEEADALRSELAVVKSQVHEANSAILKMAGRKPR